MICSVAAGLLLVSFVVLAAFENSLDERRAGVVLAMNLLGRQRMQSQVLVRHALQADRGRQGLRQYHLDRLQQVRSVMGANEAMLQSAIMPRPPRARREMMQEKLAVVAQGFADIDETVGRLIARLDGRTDTTALPDELTETLPTECDIYAEALDGVVEEVVAINQETHASFRLVGWWRIGVAGLIVLGAVFLLTRGQISTLQRLIDTGTRFEELTYLQDAVLESTTHSIISTNHEGRIVTFNRGAENLTGYLREEMVGIHTPDLIHDPAEVARAAKEVSAELGVEIAPGFEVFVAHARRGVVREREYTYVRKDGTRVPVSLSVTAMRSSEGKITGFLGVASDITEKKQMEQQFLRSQRIESIGTLAGGIAHDLNNVLTPVLMSIELLRVTNTNERNIPIYNSIESSARRGADMVKQILSFARGVEGERSLVNVGLVIRDIQRLIQETFPKNIHSVIQRPADLPPFMGDPTQLHQILLNLCVNARDAMPAGGTLTITAKCVTLDESAAAMQMDARPGAYVSICVKDTGTGIPSEVINKIFDPFFTTKEIGKGTGLGLSTVLAITKSHGGFIQVASEPDAGTTFTVCLPAVLQAEEPPPVAQTENPMQHGGGKLILIVDDEDAVRTITQQTLETLGYRTMVAADGVEAVALYSRHNDEIDAVLTDMMMPIMSGPATIQVLRRINPAVKIIAASGITHNGGLSKAAELGIKHFLPKPYSAQTMLSTLHTLLN